MFDVLDDLEDAVGKLLASEPAADDLERVSNIAERIEFARLRVVGAFDRSGVWSADGFVSTASAMRSKLRCSHGHALRSVRRARKLEQLPATSAAFGAGEITTEHVVEITRPYTPARAGMLEGIETELVNYAKISTPHEVRETVQGMCDAFDGDKGANSDDTEHALNKITLSTTGGRGILSGSLDAELTDVVLTALDAEMEALREAGRDA
jgi:hypothetical protein